ncbi:transporter substrate-binding domain-containing protein [Simiduia sp. 21SJ11W-1]|uniref:substrate-binding periplasmic protein n=1 Tax=Simiduia sp. 21SJ11W-1 TaxID=2909669 RepID=UPI0020A21CB6|nr:transporter substrate-binding domain-containing protein [Simiduia sp. 21SJ11W-1]UTA47260.1 transporter substrate-binding domain-containing protein [Simiduia sp. 21SJ11W-1]
MFRIALAALLLSATVEAGGPGFTLGTEAVGYSPHYHWGSGPAPEYAGFARELFDAFASQENLQLHYLPLPVKRLYQQFLRTGGLDFKYPDSPEWQAPLRAGLSITYSRPAAHYIDGIISLNQQPPLKRLGTIRGFNPTPYLHAIHNGDIAISEFTRVTDLLQALLHQRIDGAYLNIDVGMYQASGQLGAGARVCFNTQLPFVSGGYRLATRKHPEVIAAFDRFLQTNATRIAAMKQRHGVQLAAIDLNNVKTRHRHRCQPKPAQTILSTDK